jgi:hypothetical protein
LVGPADLSNDTAPSDFDPAGINSVRFQWTLSHTGTISDDSWSINSTEIETTGGTQLADVASSGTMNSGTPSVTIDLTDNSPNNGASVADWEGAQFNGITAGSVAGFTQNMGPDGAAARILASSVTITIDYEPSSGSSHERTLAVAGAGAVTLDGQREALRELSVAGAGAVALNGQRETFGSMSVAGQSSINIEGEIPSEEKTGSMTVAGAGSVSIEGQRTTFGSVQIDAISAITFDGQRETFGELTIPGVGTITFDGFKEGEKTGTLTVPGSGAISIEGQRETFGSLTIDGQSAISIEGDQRR